MTSTDSARPAAGRPAATTRTIALVGLAHGTSHFFHLLLPPLFPAFIRDFGLSYSELGPAGDAVLRRLGRRPGAGRFRRRPRRRAAGAVRGAGLLRRRRRWRPRRRRASAGLLLARRAGAAWATAPFHPVGLHDPEHARLAAAPGARVLGARHQRQPRLGAGAGVPDRLSTLLGSWRAAPVRQRRCWALAVLALLVCQRVPRSTTASGAPGQLPQRRRAAGRASTRWRS
ncbi:MAG: hypothetical protein MZW92_16100 [Comamonadaceae bacterium]|nr:hypothetical protein [Comamonadaceae bacterium]